MAPLHGQVRQIFLVVPDDFDGILGFRRKNLADGAFEFLEDLEPLDARMTRTASLTMSWSASCESSVEWMTLLT